MNTDETQCLQCGEYKAAVVASQKTNEPIYCAEVDYFGECLWEADRHRFRDWSDKELIEGWGVLPEAVGKYRRIMSGYEIADEDRRPFGASGGGSDE